MLEGKEYFSDSDCDYDDGFYGNYDDNYDDYVDQDCFYEDADPFFEDEVYEGDVTDCGDAACYSDIYEDHGDQEQDGNVPSLDECYDYDPDCDVTDCGDTTDHIYEDNGDQEQDTDPFYEDGSMPSPDGCYGFHGEGEEYEDQSFMGDQNNAYNHNDYEEESTNLISSDDDDAFPYPFNYDMHFKPSEASQNKNATTNEGDPQYLKRILAETKKDHGNFLYKLKRYESALLKYTEAIHYLPSEPMFYTNRSACYMMMSKYTEAIADARTAIVCDKKYERAYVRLVTCLILTGDYSAGLEAIEEFLDVHPSSSALLKHSQDCKELAALDNLIGVCYANREYKNVLVYLNKALKIATASEVYKTLKAECESLVNTKDYYDILGVSKNASLAELKAAFRKQAVRHHPDKHSGLSEEQKKKHEEKFKLVKEAYDVLTGHNN